MQRMGRPVGEQAKSAFDIALAVETAPHHRRILLFISPPGNISGAMAAAIEREFPWISVRHVQEPRMACTLFDEEVQLIIIDRNLLDMPRQDLDRLSSFHPGAGTAVMGPVQTGLSRDLAQLVAARASRGILPMDVNLDIWLSIIHIMLKGGEYLPLALVQKPLQSNEVNGAYAHAVHRTANGQRGQWSETIDKLTERELQVLTMVSRGLQNKIIAAELHLSEHTVKIHLRNIIKKLGVHNRTEAASKYFSET